MANKNTGQKILKSAKQVIPGGNQLLSKRSEMFLPGYWPNYYEKAKGCSVWDLDHNHYFDFCGMGVTSCILGYANNFVDNNVIKAIKGGSMSSLNSLEEYELSKRKKITLSQKGKLNILAIILLFLIIPLRHLIFDVNGVATALLLICFGTISFISGLFYEWKSFWCSGLCPVHPVEKLYGIKNLMSFPNAHCDQCQHCVIPCPDSKTGITPYNSNRSFYDKLSGFFMVGAFPGFIWGWFQVPDYHEITDIEQLLIIYLMPLKGASISSIFYFVLSQYFSEKKLIPYFSTFAISCYYWYRLPALLGFGIFPGDGMLINLSNTLPLWTINIITITICCFFVWWIIIRKNSKVSWSIRPSYAHLNKGKN